MQVQATDQAPATRAMQAHGLARGVSPFVARAVLAQLAAEHPGTAMLAIEYWEAVQADAAAASLAAGLTPREDMLPVRGEAPAPDAVTRAREACDAALAEALAAISRGESVEELRPALDALRDTGDLHAAAWVSCED